MITAVIIDVDDTLCMTEAVCFEVENKALAALGRPPMSREVHQKTWGQPLFEAIRERSPGVDPEQFKAAFWPLQDQAVAEGQLDAISAETYQTLDTLIASGKSIFILTSRLQPELTHMLAPAHELASRISGFYHADNTQFHKPDPRVFDELLQQHHLLPEECVYIGDSIGDAQAANNAGVHFIVSLESGLRTKEDFAELTVDAFVPVFSAIVAAIEQLT